MPTDDVVTLTTVGADGQESQVTVARNAILEAVRDTHVPKDRIQAELDRRVQGIVRNQGLRKPDELLDDPDFVARIAEKHGLKKPADGDGSSPPNQQLKDALARQWKELEEKELKPLKEKLTAKEAREEVLLTRDLERQIIQAAAPYVREGMLKPPGSGRQPPIVAMLADSFVYDEDASEFYAADESGNPILATNQAGGTYKTVNDLVTEWLERPENADFRRPGQSGPGVAAGPTRGQPGSVTLSAEEGADAATYRKALERVGGDHAKLVIRSTAGSW